MSKPGSPSERPTRDPGRLPTRAAGTRQSKGVKASQAVSSPGWAAAAVKTTQPITIEVPLRAGREDAASSVKQVLEAIAPFVADATVAHQDDTFREIVDKIVEATPIRRLDTMRAALEQRTIAAVFDGTEWLSAEQVGRLRDPDARNPHGTANRWRSERKVFALSKNGIQWFPRYAFDESLDPRPVIARVIEIFDGYSAFRVAAWFDSANGHLGGRRPRDVLQGDPDAVINAAREHIRGPVHG
jgi:hypothetical protein